MQTQEIDQNSLEEIQLEESTDDFKPTGSFRSVRNFLKSPVKSPPKTVTLNSGQKEGIKESSI